MAITYNNLYLDIRQQLRRSGVEAATLEARELVCAGSGKSRGEFYRDGGLYTSPEIEEAVRALVRREEVPAGLELERATVEDIILFMVKGAK